MRGQQHRWHDVGEQHETDCPRRAEALVRDEEEGYVRGASAERGLGEDREEPARPSLEPKERECGPHVQNLAPEVDAVRGTEKGPRLKRGPCSIQISDDRP